MDIDAKLLKILFNKLNSSACKKKCGSMKFLVVKQNCKTAHTQSNVFIQHRTSSLRRKILGLSRLKRYFTISILIPAKYSLLTRERRTLSQYDCLFATTNQPHT